MQCPHNLIGKTKLDSIDKVVDLIRTVSRDISPDSSKDCDCISGFYQEKENQTDEFASSSTTDDDCNYAEKIRLQQDELYRLNEKLNEMVVMNLDATYYFVLF